ncbi:MAG: hypothetical protein ACT4R6_00070 [Gemmatimonadaceae bacterium]
MTLSQTAPSRTLVKPDVQFSEPFTQIAAVRELRDGRLIVADARDKIVQLVDFRSGTATKIGREGQGPGEYSLPMALAALPGDTTAVFDPLNQRYLLIGPDAKPGSFFSARAADDNDAPARGPGVGVGAMRVSMTPPRGTDRSGNLYVSGAPFRIGPDGPITLDSVPVQRFNRTKAAYETVAHVRVPPNNARASGGGGRMEVRIGGANPFAPRDEWAVAPHGSIAIVHAAEYRVEWVAPNGKRTLGPPISYDRIKVTEAHKKWWQETQRRRGGGVAIMNREGRTSVTTAPPAALPPDARDDWPDYLPPFLANAVQVAPNGEVWVLRAAASDAVAPTYDVFDATGRLAARVTLAKRSRVVGFGASAVYVARYDEDDLQYLQRFSYIS